MATKQFWDETLKAIQSLTDEEFEKITKESSYDGGIEVTHDPWELKDNQYCTICNGTNGNHLMGCWDRQRIADLEVQLAAERKRAEQAEGKIKSLGAQVKYWHEMFESRTKEMFVETDRIESTLSAERKRDEQAELQKSCSNCKLFEACICHYSNCSKWEREMGK